MRHRDSRFSGSICAVADGGKGMGLATAISAWKKSKKKAKSKEKDNGQMWNHGEQLEG